MKTDRYGVDIVAVSDDNDTEYYQGLYQTLQASQCLEMSGNGGY